MSEKGTASARVELPTVVTVEEVTERPCPNSAIEGVQQLVFLW